jgi:hypothetical protein
MLDGVEYLSTLTNNHINEILGQMESTLAFGKLKIKWYNKDINEAINSQP